MDIGEKDGQRIPPLERKARHVEAERRERLTRGELFHLLVSPVHERQSETIELSSDFLGLLDESDPLLLPAFSSRPLPPSRLLLLPLLFFTNAQSFSNHPLPIHGAGDPISEDTSEERQDSIRRLLLTFVSLPRRENLRPELSVVRSESLEFLGDGALLTPDGVDSIEDGLVVSNLGGIGRRRRREGKR